MITHVWSVLCERSILDSKTNNLILLVLEQVKAIGRIPPGHKGKSILPLKAQLVSLWVRDPTIDDSSFEYRMRINAPKGGTVGRAVGTTKFGKNTRLRTTVEIEGIPIIEEGKGIFTFVVDYKHKGKWKNVANIPLDLEVSFSVNPPDTPS